MLWHFTQNAVNLINTMELVRPKMMQKGKVILTQVLVK